MYDIRIFTKLLKEELNKLIIPKKNRYQSAISFNFANAKLALKQFLVSKSYRDAINAMNDNDITIVYLDKLIDITDDNTLPNNAYLCIVNDDHHEPVQFQFSYKVDNNQYQYFVLDLEYEAKVATIIRDNNCEYVDFAKEIMEEVFDIETKLSASKHVGNYTKSTPINVNLETIINAVQTFNKKWGRFFTMKLVLEISDRKAKVTFEYAEIYKSESMFSTQLHTAFPVRFDRSDALKDIMQITVGPGAEFSVIKENQETESLRTSDREVAQTPSHIQTTKPSQWGLFSVKTAAVVLATGIGLELSRRYFYDN